MTQVHRVLPPEPVRSLDEHLKRRGGRGIEVAREVEPEALIDELEAAGLRGRGGAGFPTHIKWRTVRANASAIEPTTVVVNGAEGEPGTYKDRTILRLDPYHAIEGALIAAIAVGADRIVFGLKRSFGDVGTRVRSAVAEVEAAGLGGGHRAGGVRGSRRVPLRRGDGPARDHRRPLSVPSHRTAVPPGRRRGGRVRDGRHQRQRPVEPRRDGRTATDRRLRRRWSTTSRRWPTCPGIIARGGSWFRTEGTDESPGTIVCTVTGSVQPRRAWPSS